STAKSSKVQRKLKIKQESSESTKIDSDWAEYLRTYDSKNEDPASEEVTSKLNKKKTSKYEITGVVYVVRFE
ncbi:hypothetical protein A2U01_0095702, partial [Trifolium medium]|nr:hypothetical protein [Trifolium medium]